MKEKRNGNNLVDKWKENKIVRQQDGEREILGKGR